MCSRFIVFWSPCLRNILLLRWLVSRSTSLCIALLFAATLLCPASPLAVLSGAAFAAQQPKPAKASPVSSSSTSPETSAKSGAQKTETSFSFLGVGKTSKIDPTRKTDFEDYKLRPEHSCIGCWCNHAFGNRLNESLYDLDEKSASFQAVWKQLQTCLDPKQNAVPQIRSLYLQPKYSDTVYSKILLYFSEFLDKPLAFTLVAANPDKTLEELTQRFGVPESVDDTWYLWNKDGDFMVLDLFDKKYKKQHLGIVYVYFLSTLDAHLAAVRRQLHTDKPHQKSTD